MRAGTAFTLPAPGTAGENAKPDANTPEYTDIGAIEDWEFDVSGGTDHEVWRPSPGRLQLKDVITVKEKMTLKFTTGETSAFAVGHMMRTDADLDADSTQFNPMEGTPPQGWLHVALYDHDDVLVLTAEVWGRLKCTGGLKASDGSLVKPTWEFLVLYSQYNTATL